MTTKLGALVLAGALATGFFMPSLVKAQSAPPAMHFLTAPLVSPTAAEGYYGTGTTHSSSFTGVSGFEGNPPEVVELARALKNDPDLIYEWVHNQVETEWAFGARKGPLGAIIDKSATAFDQNILFVNLVRQAGYQARYRIGRVTIAAADFASWTGVSDIQAACRLLSSGGIPAAFNGAGASPSDCSQTGSFSSVTLLHAWSEVLIGGSWYAYDPSFKAHTVSPGINLTSKSGLTSGAPASQAASGADAGSQSSLNYIHNLNTAGLDSYLQARGTQLLGDLVANENDWDTAAVVGITKIAPTYKPAGGWRNTTPAGYSAVADLTITGDIPDQYRTGLHVTLAVQSMTSNEIDRQLWADETYGRRIGFDTNWDNAHAGQGGSGYPGPEAYLTVDDVVLGAYNSCSTGAQTSACYPGIGGYLTLTANHPYAANSGSYADQTIKRTIQLALPVTIVAGWGMTAPALGSKWSTERQSDKSMPCCAGSADNGCDPSFLCYAEFQSPVGDVARQGLAASWLAQFSRMLTLNAAIGNGVGEHQHSIGVISASYDVNSYSTPVNPTSVYTSISEIMTVSDIETSISLTSKVNNQTSVNAMARTVAVVGSALEASILEQSQDLPDTASTASRFAWANAPSADNSKPGNYADEDPCHQGARRFFDYTGSSSANRAASYVYEGSSTGCGAGPTLDTSVPDPSGWKGAHEVNIASYLTAGFKVSAPAEAFMGPGARFGAPKKTINCDGQTHVCVMHYVFAGSRQRGSAVIATQLDASGNVTAVAHFLTNNSWTGKGGGGSEPQRYATYDPHKAADLLKDRFVDRSVALGVDLKTGTAGFTTPTLLSVGSGEGAPYRFDFTLTYKNGWDGCNSQFGPCLAPLQAGWIHNFDLRFTNSGSGLEAMGASSPRAAAGSLTAFLALQDIFASSGISNMQQDVTAALVADWWRQQMVANVATLNQAFSGKQYIRLVDGSWLAPIGSPGVLTQNGARLKTRDICAQNNGVNTTQVIATQRRWDHSGVTFDLRNAGGDTVHVGNWTTAYSSEGDNCAIAYGYGVTSWTWPQGPSITFNGGTPAAYPSSLTTSLGRTASIGVTLTSAGLTAGEQSDGSIANAAGEAYRFDYTSAGRSATQRPYGPSLVHVYEPVNPSQPALEYGYDRRGMVAYAKDATAIQWKTRGAYNWFIAEGGRAERDDPLGGAYTVYYDTDGQAVRSIDELGRETDRAHDGRGRTTSRAYPEGDWDQFGYDGKDNVTLLIKHPKASSPEFSQGVTIAAGASYDPTWNKIASVTDGMGNVTTFSYYASGAGASLMSQATRPADANGNHPVYSFQYNAQGLPTQEVDPTGVTTTHAYDSYGNLTATTTAAAANGQPALNLTTNFYGYTSQGDAQAILDPRGAYTQQAFDAMRRLGCEWHGGGPTWLAVSCRWFDLNGRQTHDHRATSFDANNNVTGWQLWQTSYTPTGKVASKTDPLGHVTLTQYDALDRISRMIDATGHVDGFAYDAAGQKTQECKAIGTPLQQGCWPAGQSGAPAYASFTYSPNGQPIIEADARGNAITTAYDGLDRLKRTTYADNSFEQNDYDPNGNVLTLTTRAGLQIRSTYDALNRRISELGWDPATNQPYLNENSLAIRNSTFAYDLAGRMKAVTNGYWDLSWTYDAAGRPIEHGNGFLGSTTTNYDAAGNVVYVDHPDGVFESFEYDLLNRMSLAKLNGSTVAALSYDTLSRRTLVAFQDTSSQAYTYDAADRLTGLTHLFPNASNQNVVFSYGYDAAGRTTSKSASNPAYLDTPNTASTTYAAADVLNRYSTVGASTLAYSPDGSISQSSKPSTPTNNYVYDERRHLTYIVSNSQSRVDQHDALGRRFNTSAGFVDGSSTPIYMAFDPTRDEVRGEATFSCPTSNCAFNGWRDYVLGPNPDERLAFGDVNGTIYYPHTDRQGSTIGLSAAGQNVLLRTYGPYGEPRQSLAGLGPGAASYPYLYTGQHYDPHSGASDSGLGLYYYKARVYDPGLGRFLQPDPIGPGDELNLYGAFHNDPLNGSDPLGTQFCGTRIGASDGSVCGGSGYSDQTPTNDVAEGRRRMAQERQQNGGQRDAIAMGAIAIATLPGAVATGVAEFEIAASAGISNYSSYALEGLGERAKELHSLLDSFSQSKKTTAIAEAANGQRFVSSSQRLLSPAQRAALRPGEMAVTNLAGSHAEVSAVRAAQNAGQRVINVQPSRPMCPQCQAILRSMGIPF